MRLFIPLLLGACAASSEPATASHPAAASAGSTEVAGLSCLDHRNLVAWSPDGQRLAFWTADALRVQDAEGTEVGKVAWMGDPATALAFAGPQALAVLTNGATGSALRRFHLPDLVEQAAIPLGLPAASALVGRADRGEVAVGPVAPRLWRGEATGSNGAAVIDLGTGAVVGGGGPLYSAQDAATLGFTRDELRAMALGSLRSWSIADRAQKGQQAVSAGAGVCQVVEGASGPILGWASPAAVGPVGAPKALGTGADTLYQLVTGGDRVIAIVATSSAGKVEKVAAVDGASGARWPLDWPLTGVALRPDGQVLAVLGSAGITRVALR